MRTTFAGAVVAIVVTVSSTAVVRPPSQLDRAHEPPGGPVADHAVGFYDSGLRRVVLVGGPGDPSGAERDRMWSWSGTQWELLTDDGPTGRVNAAAAFDVTRARAVVAGGSRKAADRDAWEVVGDAWEGSRGAWSPIAGLAPRDHHSMVRDVAGGLLLFGGIPADRSRPWPGDTWRLVDGRWRQVATEGPAARGRTALAYDSRRQQVVLFGGVSAPDASNQQVFLGDTWTWDGARWARASDAGPRGRYAHGMVYDERRGVVLLYSGAAAHRDAPLGDMWQWDGRRWTEIPLTGSSPGPRYQPVMVFDAARDVTLLYGGIGGAHDTWEWDGRRWERR